MRVILCLAIASIFAVASPQAPKETETKVKMKDLPAAVQAAVREQSKAAELKGLSKEIVDGVTRYEAELRANGKKKDVTFDESGRIVSVETEVTLASIPAPAREVIQKSIGKGKLLLVETVEEGGNTFYEAHIRKGLFKEVEVKVDAAGQAVK